MTSFSIFEATIALPESPDYKRLSTLILGIIAAALFNSGIYWLVKMLLMGLLFFQWIKIYQNPRPMPAIESISFKPDCWQLHLVSGECLTYEKAQSLIDTGLFQLIALINNEKRSQTLVIFRDQLAEKPFYVLQRRLNLKKNC